MIPDGLRVHKKAWPCENETKPNVYSDKDAHCLKPTILDYAEPLIKFI